MNPTKDPVTVGVPARKRPAPISAAAEPFASPCAHAGINKVPGPIEIGSSLLLIAVFSFEMNLSDTRSGLERRQSAAGCGGRERDPTLHMRFSHSSRRSRRHNKRARRLRALPGPVSLRHQQNVWDNLIRELRPRSSRSEGRRMISHNQKDRRPRRRPQSKF